MELSNVKSYTTPAGVRAAVKRAGLHGADYNIKCVVALKKQQPWEYYTAIFTPSLAEDAAYIRSKGFAATFNDHTY